MQSYMLILRTHNIQVNFLTPGGHRRMTQPTPDFCTARHHWTRWGIPV